jgi:molecular chaperone GrpE (heat shock protein)
MKKLKKKELLALLNNKINENEVLLEIIKELKISLKNKKEKIIYKEPKILTRAEQRIQAKINYFKKRFEITKNNIYQIELDRII